MSARLPEAANLGANRFRRSFTSGETTSQQSSVNVSYIAALSRVQLSTALTVRVFDQT